MDLEKETLKLNGTGLTGTRRILPKEVYELEEDNEREGKPKGWLSWFRGIYGRDAPDDNTISEPPVKTPDTNPQSRSPGQNATTKNDSTPTSIFSKILPTVQKSDSANDTQQLGVSSKKTTTESNVSPKEGDPKS